MKWVKKNTLIKLLLHLLGAKGLILYSFLVSSQYERAKKSPVEKSPPVEADQPEFLRVHSRIYKTKSSW